jgi:hypothetical protein
MLRELVKLMTYRVENVACCNGGKGEDNRPCRTVNAPLVGHERRGTDDDASKDNDTAHERHPEALQDLRDLLEEVGAFDLLQCRRPRDVVREQVSEDGL